MSNVITKNGAPTVETVGYVGQRYVDIDTCDVYECKAIETIESVNNDPSYPNGFVCVSYADVPDNVYVWEKIKSVGGANESPVFHVEVDWDNDVTITPVAEIEEAFNSGKIVYAARVGETAGTPYMLAAVEYNYKVGSGSTIIRDTLKQFEFCSLVRNDGAFSFISIKADGTVEGWMKDVGSPNDWQPG